MTPARAALADELSEARKASEAGDFKGAEPHYRAALKSNPDNADAQRELAVVLYNEALILGRKDQYGPTVPLLTEALERAPGLRDARIALALSYDKLGKRAEAAAQLAQIGARYLASGDAPDAAMKAEDAFKEAIRRVDNPDYHVGLGDARAARGDFHGALQAYREVERNPEMKGPLLPRRMGDAYSGLGLEKQALESYEKAESVDRTPDTAMFLVKLYTTMGRYDDAIAKVSIAEGKGQRRNAAVAFLLANAHYLKALRALEAKATDEANKSFEESIKATETVLSKESSAELYQLKGLALLMMHRAEEGVAALEAGIKAGKGDVNPQVYRALAAAYDQLGKPDKAAEARSHLKSGS